MAVPVATFEFVQGAHLLAEAVHTYIRQFGQLALLAVPPVQNPLAFLLLFEHQPGDRLLALPSDVSIASGRNYSYHARL
jgi:hypothetical protein